MAGKKTIRRMSISDILRTPGLEDTFVEVRGVIAWFEFQDSKTEGYATNYFGNIMDPDKNGKLFFFMCDHVYSGFHDAILGFSENQQTSLLMQGKILLVYDHSNAQGGILGYKLEATGFSDGVQYKTKNFVVLPE